MKIGTFYASKMEFLIASEDEFLDTADGVLGMDTTNKTGINSNLVRRLYQNGQIKRRIFSVNLKNEMTATMTIGEIPEHIQNDKEKYSRCKVRYSESGNWNCLVTHILFGDNSNFFDAIELEETLINFATGVSNIYIPQSYIDLFINKYFATLPKYSNKNCIIKKSSRTKNIMCLKEFLNFDGPNINFIINGYAYQIPFEDLFEDIFSDSYNQYKLFKIDFTDTPHNEWYFGTVFIKQYEMVFDGEKMEIGFYSGVKVDFTKWTNENVEEFCLYNYLAVTFLALIMIIPTVATILTKKKDSDYLANLVLKKNKKK